MLSTNNKTLFTSPDSEGFQELGQEPKYYDRRCCYCYYLSGNSKGLGSWEPGTIDYISNKAFLVAQMVKNPPTSVGDLGLIPGLGRSIEGGNGNPLLYSCLENSMDGGALHKEQLTLSLFTLSHEKS